MALSLFIIKKWALSFIGRSPLNCNQDEGKIYSKETVAGYYNNLTEKVTKFGCPGGQLPMSQVDGKNKLYFSIAIFQYGLAAYDLYLMNNDVSMLEKVKASADWALKEQQANGGWKTFTFYNDRPDQLYSAMAQGEGISLLIRAYIAFKNEEYLNAAEKAKIFMLKPISEGGTTEYGDGVYLYEYLNAPLVLNGWIFSAWGLFDYAKFFRDDEVMTIWHKTVESIVNKLPNYDHGDWSLYHDDGKSLANPFYHKLHIAQLNVMHDLTGIEAFSDYSLLFQKYQKNPWYRIKTFLTKIVVKIREKR